MKRSDFLKWDKIRGQVKLFVLIGFVVLSAWIFSGCKTMASVDGGEKHTDTEYGWGGTLLVGGPLHVEKTSVYGLASYHRYSFDNGHDNLLQLGAQVRRDLGKDSKFWAGGEVAWVSDKSIYDDADWSNPTSKGYSIGGLAGYRLPVPIVDLSVFTGVSFIHFGDFKADNVVIDPAGNSVQLRVGLELGLPF